MLSQSLDEFGEMKRRLEKLERENRVFKRGVLAIAVLAMGMLLMGQARPTRVVEAEGFVLKDASGVTRATLGVSEHNALLTMYDVNGGKTKGATVELGAGPIGPFLHLTDEHMNKINLSESVVNQSLSFYDGSGNLLTLLSNDGTDNRLYFQSSDGHLEASVNGSKTENSSILLTGAKDSGGRAVLNGSSLDIGDNEGFSAHLGRTDLITISTGEKHTTSAASVVLFGSDKRVLWSAP